MGKIVKDMQANWVEMHKVTNVLRSFYNNFLKFKISFIFLCFTSEVINLEDYSICINKTHNNVPEKNK